MSAKHPGTSPIELGPKVDLSQYKLIFPLPIKSVIQNIVKMSNRENTKIAYKLKTNTKSRYVVRPNVGFLHPREEVILKFTLDPKTFQGDVPDESTDDWFLFETRFITPEDDCTTTNSYWHPVGGGAPTGQCSRRRLICVYTRDVPNDMVVRRPCSQSLSSNVSQSVRPNHNNTQSVSVAGSAASNGDNLDVLPVAPLLPLFRQPAKSPNPPNPTFVADEFRNDEGEKRTTKDIIVKLLTFPIPLPIVLLLLLFSFACAFSEDPNSSFARFIIYIFGFRRPASCYTAEMRQLEHVGASDTIVDIAHMGIPGA